MSFLSLFSFSAFAYETVSVTSFQNIDYTKDLTGEIYLKIGPNAKASFSYCVDRITSMNVPGTYYAVREAIAAGSAMAKAAWLEDKYAYSHGGQITYNNRLYSATETGTAVQLAIWQVLGQGINPVASYQYLFDLSGYLAGLTPDKDVSGHYMVLRQYTDTGLTHKTQDLLTPVPLPGALLLFGTGLIGLAGFRRKSKR